VGAAFPGIYVADKGFEATENHRRWLECYGAEVVRPPKRNSKMPCSKRLRRWVASLRQIVETVYDKLFNAFGLWRERPHERWGVCGRLLRRGWLCTTSASGSTTNSVAPGWPLPTCWDGDPIVHTKRSRRLTLSRRPERR
jgi:hypothetical protein